MTLPRLPIPKASIRELTPDEIKEETASLRMLAEKMRRRGEAPLNYCFGQLYLNAENRTE